MTEYDSLNFTGPKADFTLCDGAGWHQRHVPDLLRQAPGSAGYISQKDIRSATHIEPCNDEWLDVNGCPPKPPQAIWSTCRGCGARVQRKQLTAKLRLCKTCGPGPKVAA